jgi:hypothetical protein
MIGFDLACFEGFDIYFVQFADDCPGFTDFLLSLHR